jgi:YVTN family beta-propeller protein
MSTVTWRSALLRAPLAAIALLAACDAGDGPTRPTTTPDPGARAALAQSANDLARTFALWLRDEQARAAVREAVRHSEFKEGKVSWRAFTNGPAAGLLARGPKAEQTLRATAAANILGAFGDLEVYFPVPVHRATWAGGDNLIVAVYLGPAQISDGWVGYDLNGNVVPMSRDLPPVTPVLMIHRPEGFRRIVAEPMRQECIPSETDPCDPPPPPPPPPSPNRVALSGSPFGVAVAGGIAYITQPTANRVARFDLASNTFTASIATASLPAGIVFNAAGTKAYVAHLGAHSVGIIDVATNTVTGSIPVTGDPLPVAISGDGNTLFTTTNVNQLFKIDLQTNTVVASLNLPATSHFLFMHPNDQVLYVATRDGGSVMEVEWRTMTVARTFTTGGRPQGMTISPDRSELYVANETSNRLHVINLSSGAIMNVALEGGGHGIALNASGTKMFVGLVLDGRVQVLDRATRATIVNANTGGRPRMMAGEAGGRELVANEAGWLDIFGANGSLPPEPPPPPPPQPPPLPKGYYMTGWNIQSTYEPWYDADPEYEIVAWIDNGNREPLGAWGCAAGDYPSSSPRDWYYNEEGEYHTAAEQGRQGITILDSPQWTAYWTGPSQVQYPRRTWLTENDDETCAEGAFPSIGNPDNFGNDDDMIGEWLTPQVTQDPFTRFFGPYAWLIDVKVVPY